MLDFLLDILMELVLHSWRAVAALAVAIIVLMIGRAETWSFIAAPILAGLTWYLWPAPRD